MPRQRRFLTRPEPYYCLSSDLTDNFRLPDKGASDLFITLRSAAPDSALPPAGVRITPAYAAQLPKIQSATSVSALRTKNYAHHWRLMFLEYRANLSGYGDIIQLGSGDTSQYDLTPVAHDLIVDRVYVHGDPVMGQKRGVALNSRDTQVLNSYIADIKPVRPTSTGKPRTPTSPTRVRPGPRARHRDRRSGRRRISSN
jgi:hypothetical protein